MPSNFSKLIKCLRGTASRIVTPQLEDTLRTVAEPEEAFGWAGSMFGSSNAGVAAVTAFANALTIPDDCFYIIDAAYLIAPAAVGTKRIAFELVNPEGTLIWSQQVAGLLDQFSAVGIAGVQSQPLPTLRVHLRKNSIVRWRSIDSTVGDTVVVSYAVRMLYQDQE